MSVALPVSRDDVSLCLCVWVFIRTYTQWLPVIESMLSFNTDQHLMFVRKLFVLLFCSLGMNSQEAGAIELLSLT